MSSPLHLPAQALHTLLEGLPRGVRRRLEERPLQPGPWSTTPTLATCTVADHTVTVGHTQGAVEPGSWRCTCFVSPRCAHVGAAAQTLPSLPPNTEDAPAPPHRSPAANHPPSLHPTDEHRRFVAHTFDHLAALLHGGLRVVPPSHPTRFGLLSAEAQRLRLWILASQLQRLGEAPSVASLHRALTTTLQLHHATASPWSGILVGTSRRVMAPLGPVRAVVVALEPLRTAQLVGVIVWLTDPTGRMLQLAQLGPSAHRTVEQLSHTGLPLGELSLSPRALLGQAIRLRGAKVSEDGRLSQGKQVQGRLGPRPTDPWRHLPTLASWIERGATQRSLVRRTLQDPLPGARGAMTEPGPHALHLLTPPGSTPAFHDALRAHHRLEVVGWASPERALQLDVLAWRSPGGMPVPLALREARDHRAPAPGPAHAIASSHALRPVARLYHALAHEGPGNVAPPTSGGHAGWTLSEGLLPTGAHLIQRLGTQLTLRPCDPRTTATLWAQLGVWLEGATEGWGRHTWRSLPTPTLDNPP